jgi:hypothetical protein
MIGLAFAGTRGAWRACVDTRVPRLLACRALILLLMKTNGDEKTSLPVPIRGTGRRFMVASTRRILCYTLLLASRAMTELEARLTAIEDFAGLADSSSRDSRGIESAETEGDRAYYCTCAVVRGIFPAVLPWLLPWPTPRMRIVVMVWQACTKARPGVQAL